METVNKGKMNVFASADDFLSSIAESFTNLQASLPPQTENVAVEASGEANKENNMDEIKKEECGTAPVTAAEPAAQMEATAAEDKAKDELDAVVDDKVEEKEEDKPADEGEKKDEPKEEEKKKEIKESDFKKAEDLLKKVLDNEKAEAAGGENEDEDIKNLKEALKALGMKVEEAPAAEEGLGAEMPAAPEAPAAPAMEEEVEIKEDAPAAEGVNPFASLVATLDKKASVADSMWMIKNAKDNSDVLSFSVKAAFGNNIDKDTIRSKYAMSEEFGKAVIAALINEKVASATGAKAAVLGVVAHYSPSYAGVNEYKSTEPANPGKSGTKPEEETDKNIPGTEVKASAQAGLTKQASEEVAGEDGKIATDAKIFPTPAISEKVNTKADESGHPKATEKVEETTDRKLIASYEEQIQKQASEISALKLEAAIKEKSAKVKEAINLMARLNLVKANEHVRVAALKDGLSIEAANAKAMAASIDTQSKNLFGMNTPQLDAYIKSLAELAPRGKAVQASTMSPLNVKASDVETEEERLSKVLGWD